MRIYDPNTHAYSELLLAHSLGTVVCSLLERMRACWCSAQAHALAEQCFHVLISCTNPSGAAHRNSDARGAPVLAGGSIL